MLRPEIRINIFEIPAKKDVQYKYVINPDVLEDDTSTQDDNRYIVDPEFLNVKYIIKPSSVSIDETREGISLTFKTKTNKKILKVGDKIQATIQYKTIEHSFQRFPVMVVSDTQIDDEGTFEVLAIDEFSFYSRIITFLPNIETSEAETKYLRETFNLNKIGQETITDEELSKLKNDINLYDLLGYLQLRLYKLMHYADINISDESLIKFQNNLLFSVPSDVIKSTTTVGKWFIGAGVPIIEVLKILKDNYNIQLYQQPKSYYNNTPSNKYYTVTVSILGISSNLDITKIDNPLKIVDNINIIDDNLKLRNPLDVRQLWISEYTDNLKDGKKSVETWFGYFNDNNEVVVEVNKRPISINFIQANVNKVGNAQLLTQETRRNSMISRVNSADYFGYEGNINTFQYAINLDDAIELTFNNIDDKSNLRQHTPFENSDILSNYRENGTFAIDSITRLYDEKGLFININLRQKLK